MHHIVSGVGISCILVILTKKFKQILNYKEIFTRNSHACSPIVARVHCLDSPMDTLHEDDWLSVGVCQRRASL